MKSRAQECNIQASLQRAILAIWICVLLFPSVSHALTAEQGNEWPVARIEQLFHEAGRAYDKGQFDEAASQYRQILESGHGSKETLFNLGNALFRSGRVAQAVLQYRRAQYLNPRDPDISANLRFALQTTGATVPQHSALSRFFFHVSKEEWVTLATASYWIAAAAFAMFLLLPAPFKSAGIRLLVVFVALLIVSLLGIGAWVQLCRRPEVVIIKPQQQALFAPLEQNATPHFALTEGSIVRAVEFSSGWVKIASGDREGWVKHDVCEPVCISGEL